MHFLTVVGINLLFSLTSQHCLFFFVFLWSGYALALSWAVFRWPAWAHGRQWKVREHRLCQARMAFVIESWCVSHFTAIRWHQPRLFPQIWEVPAFCYSAWRQPSAFNWSPYRSCSCVESLLTLLLDWDVAIRVVGDVFSSFSAVVATTLCSKRQRLLVQPNVPHFSVCWQY